MKVSVIIPALNEEAHIERCVRSAWDASCDEVIVADGGSSDRTLEVIQPLASRIVVSAAGRATQQNAAARHASGDVLLFMHADNWLAPRGCDQIRSALQDTHVLGGAFQQCIEARGIGFRALELGNALRAKWLGLPYGDQGIFLRREIFWELGGFPDTRLMEDLLLMKQFRKRAFPRLLPGPIFVSARRWLRYGIVGQTARNWLLLAAYSLGVHPDRLASFYAKHP